MYAEALNQEFTKSDQSAIRIDKRRVYYYGFSLYEIINSRVRNIDCPDVGRIEPVRLFPFFGSGLLPAGA